MAYRGFSEDVSKRYAMRLLRLLPSLSLRCSNVCRNDHGMVTVTRLGLRVNGVVKGDKPC